MTHETIKNIPCRSSLRQLLQDGGQHKTVRALDCWPPHGARLCSGAPLSRRKPPSRLYRATAPGLARALQPSPRLPFQQGPPHDAKRFRQRLPPQRSPPACAQRPGLHGDGVAGFYLLHRDHVCRRQARGSVRFCRVDGGDHRRQSAARGVRSRPGLHRLQERSQFGTDGAFLLWRSRQQAQRPDPRFHPDRLVCLGHGDGGGSDRQVFQPR